jgi:hypothetical protein
MLLKCIDSARAQAAPAPARNSASQHEPICAPAEVQLDTQRQPQYAAFLGRVRGDVEACLLQNAVVDLCADDFELLEEEEAIKGHRSGKPIHEVMCFMDIRHCRDMQVSALRWHPTMQHHHAVCHQFLSFLALLHRAPRIFAFHDVLSFGAFLPTLLFSDPARF